MISRLALIVLLGVSLGCSGKERTYVQGLEPTPDDVPVPIFEVGAVPECPYAEIGRLAIGDLNVDIADDGTIDRRGLHRELRKRARPMGGHAVMLVDLEATRGRVVPKPKDIADIVPETVEDDERISVAPDDESRVDPEPARGDHVSEGRDPGRVSAGVSIGSGGIRPSNQTPDRVSLHALVLRFTDPDCQR